MDCMMGMRCVVNRAGRHQGGPGEAGAEDWRARCVSAQSGSF